MSIACKEHRCTACHKLLFKGILVEGEIDIKCKHCHETNVIKKSEFNELLCLIPKCPHRVAIDHNSSAT